VQSEMDDGVSDTRSESSASARSGAKAVVAVGGNQIKAARALIGMKQWELAKAAGLTQSSLWAIEAGVADPKASTLYRLVRTLEAGGAVFRDDGVARSARSQSSASASAMENRAA
jgi:DNA-binding XRE family transcriptional regulator